MRSNILDFALEFQHQTDAAVCVREIEGGENIWIPKSRCEISPENPSRGGVINLTTDEATATEKGLI